MGAVGGRPVESPVDAAITRMAGQRVYIDTNVFIFFLQQNDKYFEIVAPFIQACFKGQIFATTGLLAIAEVMVHPYRSGNPAIIAQFKSFFNKKNFLNIVGHANEHYDTAAMLAGQKKMKLVDAMHYLAALHSGCQFILTNDRGFVGSDGLEVIQLDDLVAVSS